MTKAEIAARVAEKGLTKQQALAVVEATLEALSGALRGGERIQLVGFGSFEVRAKRTRMGRNPQTGAPIPIAARKIVKFKPGEELRLRVNATHSSQNGGRPLAGGTATA